MGLLLKLARRHGARLLAFSLVLAAASAGAVDLFAPGELSRAHSDLEGMNQCLRCHQQGKRLSQEKCLSCHDELRVEAKQGFHGRMSESMRQCESCHREHMGKGFDLIRWVPSKERFPHMSTGFALNGAHAALTCEKCHDKRRIVRPRILQLSKEHPERRTHLGLGNTCASCHFDEHRGQLGNDCRSCHVEKSWTATPGFSHAKTDYALTGAHQQVGCDKCHRRELDNRTAADVFPAPQSDRFSLFSGVAHQQCSDCHADPHDGRLGPNCSTCHMTKTWSAVRDATMDRAFHQKTRYPLEGLHLTAKCTSCHGPWQGRPAKFKGLRFEACTDCHADAHAGQLREKNGALKACNICHSVDGFTPPRFEREQHAKTAFPLDGAHGAVGCGECHVKRDDVLDSVRQATRAMLKRQGRPENFSARRFEFTSSPKRCETCHDDVHKGQFSGRDGGCASCHVVESFQKLRFDHAKTRFPLEGSHGKVACASCHPKSREDGMAVTRYRPRPLSCDGCHADVHVAQFAREKDGKRFTDCAGCHDTGAFAKTKFQHEPPFTAFLLEGKHRNAPCLSCHPKVKVGAKVVAQKFKPLPQECEGCHQDFHNGAFKGFAP